MAAAELPVAERVRPLDLLAKMTLASRSAEY